MAPHAETTQPERSDDLGTDCEASRRLSPAAANSSSVAKYALCRHAPEVGAACGNPTRAVLCGGRPVTAVPTAIVRRGAKNDANDPTATWARPT